jgi:hypothetical protein
MFPNGFRQDLSVSTSIVNQHLSTASIYQHFLTSVFLPASLHYHLIPSIFLPTFPHQHSITNISLPASPYQHLLTNIPSPTFYHQHLLTSISLPASPYQHLLTSIFCKHLSSAPLFNLNYQNRLETLNSAAVLTSWSTRAN